MATLHPWLRALRETWAPWTLVGLFGKAWSSRDIPTSTSRALCRDQSGDVALPFKDFNPSPSIPPTLNSCSQWLKAAHFNSLSCHFNFANCTLRDGFGQIMLKRWKGGGEFLACPTSCPFARSTSMWDFTKYCVMTFSYVIINGPWHNTQAKKQI